MFEILAVATITVLAVLSPGADFAMVTRNSLLHGRKAGLLTAAGIAVGVQSHVLYAMLGVALLIRDSPAAFLALRLAGAAYLVHVGHRTFVARAVTVPDDVAGPAMSPARAFRAGLFTNALNPKTLLFVVSVFTQVVKPATGLGQQVGYGLFMSLAHLAWFAIVAVFFSDERMRARLLRHQVPLNRGIGLVLALLGVGLAVGPVAAA